MRISTSLAGVSCVGAPMFLPGAPAGAAMVVTYQGLEVEAAAASYRTTSVAKQFDPDNVYGTDGYIAYGVTPVGTAGYWTDVSGDPLTYSSGNRVTLTSMPSLLSVATNNSDGVPNRISGGIWQPVVDDPEETPGPMVADRQGAVFYRDVTSTNAISMLNITFTEGLGANSVLIGILADGGVTSNKPGRIALVQTLGGSATAGVDIGAGSLSSNGVMMAVFEVSGAEASDVLTVRLTPGTDGVSGIDYKASMLGATFDVVPEPASALGLITGLGLFVRRPRRVAGVWRDQ